MIIPFPRQEPVNDNDGEEIVACAHCQNAAILIIVDVEKVARFECAACRADLTSGVLPLCPP